MSQTQEERTIEIIKKAGILRPRDLEGHGISRTYLSRLHDRGLVIRIGRGLYMTPDADITEYHTLAEVCKRVPKGVVCLLSALRFHGLTTQNPPKVWIAIGNKAHKPNIDYPSLQLMRFSDSSLKVGVEEHQIEGVSVRVYNPAKTVADCFKYRNKIGVDIAKEALRDCYRLRQCSIDDLWKYAKICRVANVIKPYLESIT